MAAAENAGRATRNVADATHDLYRQYGKQIYAYCLHQLRSREEAEDAVQTTFLNAFRGLQRGTTTSFEQAWLYKIAQNVCIARRSSSGRRLKLESPDDFEILQEVVPAEATAVDRDTLELMGLEEALDSMPENQRKAILLREWQGLSYREIAAELDLSQGAVEMLIFRARRTLALALEQPEAATQKRTNKAKTGFSFGSLIAAMKSLFSTGAAVKMAAVAVTTAAVVGTNVVHSVVQPFTAPKPKAPAPSVAHTTPAATTAIAVSVRQTPLTRAKHGLMKSHFTTPVASRPSAGSGRHPVIPETATSGSAGGNSTSTTGSVVTASDTAPAFAPSASVSTSTGSAASTAPAAPHKSAAPSSGAHHVGASVPAPASTGSAGDTTGTPHHHHGPVSSAPTNASSSGTTTSSTDTSTDSSTDGSGPVSVGNGPVGYSQGSQANNAGNGIRGGGTPSGGTPSGAGDTSSSSSSSDGSSSDQSSSDTTSTDTTSTDTSSSSSSDTSSSDSSSSGSTSGSSSDSSSGSSGRGHGHGNGNSGGDGNGNGGNGGNGGGHGHGHHGGRSIENSG